MFIETMYDTQNPEASHNVMSLFLLLDEAINVALPNGDPAAGHLRDVSVLPGGRLVKLTVEIDDKYESLYYINHRQREIDLIKKEAPWEKIDSL